MAESDGPNVLVAPSPLQIYTFIRKRISDLNNRPVNVSGRSLGNIFHFAFPDQDNIKSLATHNWTIASHE